MNDVIIKTTKKISTVVSVSTVSIIFALTVLLVVGCGQEEEGPAEKAGEEIDETIEQFKTDAKDTGQAVEEKTEEIANDAKRAVEDAAD